MRVLCREGHFAFYPRKSSDISRFSNYFGKELVSERDYYTFLNLRGVPRFSIAGLSFLNLTANTTFEGEPWEVMRENGFVYDLSQDGLVPKESIAYLVETPLVGNYFRAGGALIQPGSRNSLGRIMSYGAEFVGEGYSLNILDLYYE